MGSTTHAVAAAIVHKWILAGGYALFFAFVPRSAGRTRNAFLSIPIRFIIRTYTLFAGGIPCLSAFTTHAFLSIPIRFITRTSYAGNAIPMRFITRTAALKTT